MNTYDMTFDVPAPVTEVEVSNTNTGKSAKVRMLMDTGADATCFPKQTLDDLGAGWIKKERRAVDFRGEEVRVDSYLASFRHYDRKFAEDYYVVVEGDYGLLGRDALNEFILELNGRKRVWKYRNGK